MPEFTLKEVRLPELHLPEIKRDDIVRSLSGVRLPDVDLAKARTAKIKVPAIALTSADVGKLVAAGAAVARFVRPAPRRSSLFRLPVAPSQTPVLGLIKPRKRRSRLPILLVVAGAAAIAIWALLRRPAIREKVDAMARDARERIATMQHVELLDVDSDAPIALRSFETASSEAEGLVNATVDAGSATPTAPDADGMVANSTDGDGTPVFEEAGKPT